MKLFPKRGKMFFYPERCPFCDGVIERGRLCCAACGSKFPKSPLPLFYARGGFPCRAAFFYEDCFAEAVKRFKFRSRYELAPQLAAPLCEAVRLFERKADLITSVPMHKNKLSERGYNHAERLARAASEKLGVEYAELLVKVKDNEPQHSLNTLAKRRDNVKNAYKPADKAKIKGKTILVIDDIFTTGCTLGECCKTLEKAGAGVVLGAVLCVRRSV